MANARLFRLDGSGGEISLIDGKATITQNGRYRVISVEGETVITDFYVDEFVATNSVGKTADVSTLSWLWYVAGVFLLVAVSVTLFVFVKKDKDVQ